MIYYGDRAAAAMDDIMPSGPISNKGPLSESQLFSEITAKMLLIMVRWRLIEPLVSTKPHFPDSVMPSDVSSNSFEVGWLFSVQAQISQLRRNYTGVAPKRDRCAAVARIYLQDKELQIIKFWGPRWQIPLEPLAVTIGAEAGQIFSCF